MDPVVTGLVVVVVVQFAWLVILQMKMSAALPAGSSDCCKKNRKDLKKLWNWVNDQLKPALANCVTPNANCQPGQGDTWPPEGPGPFPE